MSTWASRRLDHVAREQRATVQPLELGSREIFHYSIPSFDEIGDGRVEPADEIGSAKTLLRGGEVLISKLNPRKPRVLVAATHSMPTVCSGEFVVLRPIGVDTRFLVYLLKSEVTRQRLDSMVQSVTRSHQRARPEDVTKTWVSLPERDEQCRIADFLDAEMARINALAGMKQRLAALLRERATALVAARLPSDARHAFLGRFGRVLRGTTFPNRYQGRSEADVPFFKVADMATPGHKEVLLDAQNWITSEDIDELRARVIPRGSIVFPRVGAALLLNPRRILGIDAVVDDNVLAFAPYGGDSRFWRHWLSTVDLSKLANPGPVPSVTEAQLRTLRAPVLTSTEQKRIADAIDQDLATINELLRNLHWQLALIAEHRQTLITAAVTGQIDVEKAAA